MHNYYKTITLIFFLIHGSVTQNPFQRVNLEKIFGGKKDKRVEYDPSKVDWASVISGCKATCRYEKRMCNFYIRAAAHDALSVRDNVGGADGSLLLTDDELRRPENKHDLFAYTVSKNVRALSEKYKASVADVLAVCGGVAVDFLGGPQIVKYNFMYPFLVGRVDLREPNPANTLAKADANLGDFVQFANDRKITMEEMTELMGTHSLLDTKGCLRTDGKTYCDPTVERCDDISMFKWSNSYYEDVCNAVTTIHKPPKEVNVTFDNDFELKQELCKYTSDKFREDAQMDFQEVPETTDILDITVEFIENSIMKLWNYTVNDAWLGKACQGSHDQSTAQTAIQTNMNKFKTSYDTWSDTYSRAYKKMISIGAKWSHFGGYAITGMECPSGYTSPIRGVRCNTCHTTFKFIRIQRNCPSSCICRTAFTNNQVYSEWVN